MNGLSQIYNAARDNSADRRHRRQQRHGRARRPTVSARCPICRRWRAASSNIRGRASPRARSAATCGARSTSPRRIRPDRPISRSPKTCKPAPSRRVDAGDANAFAATPNAHLERRPDARGGCGRGAPAARCAPADARARRVDGAARRRGARARRSVGTAGVRDRAHAAQRTAVSGRRRALSRTVRRSSAR